MGVSGWFWKLEGLSDEEVLRGLCRTLGSSRRLTAEVVAHLGEVEERRLHLDAACGSMFSYCVTRLGLSEDEAYRRIEVARLSRRCPAIFPLLASGELSLSVAALLKAHLSTENADALLAAVSGKSVQRAREALAALFPRPDVPATVRKLPEPRRASNESGELPRSCAADTDTVALPLAGVGVAQGSPSVASAMFGAGVGVDDRCAADDCATVRMAAEPARGALAAATPAPAPAPDVPAVAATPKLPIATFGSDQSSSDPRASRAPVELPMTLAPPPAGAPPIACAVPQPNSRGHAGARSIEPLSATRYKVQFTADADLKAKLDLARDLLRHAVPEGDLAAIVERALDRLLAELMKQRFGARNGKSEPSVSPRAAGSSGRNERRTSRASCCSKKAAESGDVSSDEAADSGGISSDEAADSGGIDAPASVEPIISQHGKLAARARSEPAAPVRSEPATLARESGSTRSEPAAPLRSESAAPTQEPATQVLSGPAIPSRAEPVRTPAPSPALTKHLSRAVRRAVVERDGLRCSWVNDKGTRCEERAWLEYDHRHPRGKGGASEADNVRLLCRGHNLRAAELEYGRAHVARAIVDRRRCNATPWPDRTARGG